MTKQERINQIINGITAFEEEKYLKKDLLDEYLKFEKEVVGTTFNKEHSECANLGLTHVYHYLKNLCEPYKKKIAYEFENFNKISFDTTNQIRRFVSGERGEYKTFRSLETINCPKKILRNIEFDVDGRKTEIDLVVITQRAIFNIEVKNTKKDIRIDEKGNYYTIKNNERLDKNLGEKMNEREYLLRTYLEEQGIKNPKIENILVFTNSDINVVNEYEYITHCFLSSLPNIIKNYDGHTIYNLKELDKMSNSLKELNSIYMYAPDADINGYKRVFANLLASLEELISEDKLKKQKRENSIISKIKLLFSRRTAEC